MELAKVDAEKIAEEFPNSRFRILDTAIKKPGTCVLCLSSGGDGRQFVDFGKTVDFHGVVYFCTFCIAEVAEMLGFAQKSDWAVAETELQEEISRVDDLYVEAMGQVSAARILLRNCHCDNSDLVRDDSLSDALDVESAEESEGNSDDDGESTVIEESGDVPESSVDDDSNAEPEGKPKRTRRGANS